MLLCDSFQRVQPSNLMRPFSGSWTPLDPSKPPPACLLGTADRISLGLLPSSEMAWGTALSLLNKTTGGVLHVHGTGLLEFVDEPTEVVEVRCNHGLWCVGSRFSPLEEGGRPTLRRSSRYANREPKYAVVRGKKLYLGRDVGVDLVFAQHVLRHLSEIFVAQQNESQRIETCCWTLRVGHVERVKSYAPKLHHFVVDVACCPAPVEVQDRNQ